MTVTSRKPRAAQRPAAALCPKAPDGMLAGGRRGRETGAMLEADVSVLVFCDETATRTAARWIGGSPRARAPQQDHRGARTARHRVVT